MSFTTIDLENLPLPDVVETIDAAAIVEELKTYILTLAPELDPVLTLSSEPIVKLLEVVAYRETLIRSRVNMAAKAVLLPYATGADLDNIAALMGVERQQIDAGDADATPPVDPTYEADASLRRRVELAPEGATAAGTEGSYLFYALSAHADVADAAVVAPEVGSGRVEITILSRDGDGTASEALLTEVANVMEPWRVLTDLLEFHSADVLTFDVAADLTLFPGPDATVVLEAAQAALDAYLSATRKLGYDVTISGLHAALHQPGVQNVALTSPVADVVCDYGQVAHATSTSITGDVRDV